MTEWILAAADHGSQSRITRSDRVGQASYRSRVVIVIWAERSRETDAKERNTRRSKAQNAVP
jgi:hypothetical protein